MNESENNSEEKGLKEEKPSISQSAEGTGIAQAIGERATAISFLGVPIEKLLIGELVAAIVIQCMGYLCSFGTRQTEFCLLGFGLCFPIIFGLPAVYGLLMGFGTKNKKVIMLSLASGALSLLILGPLFLCGSLGKLVEYLQSVQTP